jgi:hypothetical protein
LPEIRDFLQNAKYMTGIKLDATYWNHRYDENDTPWDLGQVSPALKPLLDAIEGTDARILIPGAGRGYEAIYLHRKGFRQVFVCDWAPHAFGLLLSQAPDFPTEHLIVNDFFELTGEFDFILEQTFFCAIDPSLRGDYVAKTHSLLSRGGKLAGVLFATPFAKPGPPFGGTEEEYRHRFEPYFRIEKMQICQHSVGPRAGNELYFELTKQ